MGLYKVVQDVQQKIRNYYSTNFKSLLFAKEKDVVINFANTVEKYILNKLIFLVNGTVTNAEVEWL